MRIDELEGLGAPPALVDDLTTKLRDAAEASSEALVEQAMEAASESVLNELEAELAHLRQVAGSEAIGRRAEVELAEGRLRLGVARVREAAASPGQAGLSGALEHLRGLPGSTSLADSLEAEAGELRETAIAKVTHELRQALERRDWGASEAAVEALRSWGDADELSPGCDQELRVARCAQGAQDALAVSDLRLARVQLCELAELGAPPPLVDDISQQLRAAGERAEELLVAQAEAAPSRAALEDVERWLAELREHMGSNAVGGRVQAAVAAARLRLAVASVRAAIQAPGQPRLKDALDNLRRLPDGEGLIGELASEAREQRKRSIRRVTGEFDQALERLDWLAAKAAVEALGPWGDPDELLSGWQQRLRDARCAEAVWAARTWIRLGDWRSAVAWIDACSRMAVNAEQVSKLQAELAKAERRARRPRVPGAPGAGEQAPHGVTMVVLAVLGYVVCPICAWVALFMARCAMAQYPNCGMTRAAYWMGLANLIAAAVAIVYYGIVFLVGAGAGFASAMP